MVVSSINGATDRQIAQAQRFVNADERALNRLAVKNYNKENKKADKSFSKKVGLAIYSTPIVALASGLALKNGVGPSAKVAAKWVMPLAAGATIFGLDNKLNKLSPKYRKAENKHPGLFTTGVLGTAIAGMIGGEKLIDKAYNSIEKANPNIFTRMDEGLSSFASKIKMPKAVSKKVKDLDLLSKIPGKDKIAGVFTSDAAKAAKETLGNVGKSALANAPELVAGIALAAIVGKVLSTSAKLHNEKTKLHNAQFETAKELTNYYSAENKSLKKENAELTAAVETFM